MLTTTEILKKVRELEIKSKKLTSDLFTGEYHSAFKGRGMSFREVREYYPGDDIRFIIGTYPTALVILLVKYLRKNVN